MSTRTNGATALPMPPVPWQVTGNHWLALPCIHPADGSLHAVGVIHRGARAAIELAGSADFAAGSGPPLVRPTLVVDGQRIELAQHGMAWERALNWLPTFTCSTGNIVIRGTIFAPYGRDADMAGAVYAIALENRGSQSVAVTLSLEGVLGHRQQRVRTARPFDDAHRVSRTPDGVVVLEGAALPGVVSLAFSADSDVDVEVDEARATFALRRELRVPAGGRSQAAFYLAAGPERDGARATVGVMRRRGWRELLTATRDALQGLEQSTGNEEMDRLINRNLLFSYFYAVGRALDDAHYYLMRTRAPWNGRGLTVRDWEALAWTLPAVQLADAALARELLIRACELHGYAPGQGVHYLDGTLFEPGFSLEGAASYAIAVDRYIRDSEDDQIVEEPVVADTLYLSADDLATRRDRNIPLYSTEVTLSGAPTTHPFTLHGNAVTAQALEIFRRTLDEETAKDVEDPEAVRAAMRRHFVLGRAEKTSFASAVDLAGASSADDDPHGSALWLPLYEAVYRQDSTYRRTVRTVPEAPQLLAQQCARLMGPDSAAVLQWLRRATLDNGLAAEEVDAEGNGTGNGGDAALSGLLAWSAWYAVHALGTRP
ncbi:MAG TPA: hypothetical protein VNB89_02645 [Gemmatimonadaceae bacterium]|nr:hypothetical protein [Gemmatimonadaceae bacterium]